MNLGLSAFYINNSQKKGLSKNSQKQSLAFKGAGDVFTGSVRFMDSNPIVSIALIDLLSMIVPRSVVDAKEKNVNAGMETFRRESSGLVINCLLPGVLSMGLASVMKNGVMGAEFKNIPMEKVWANEETIDFLSSNWQSVQSIPDKEKRLEKFLRMSFDSLEGADGAKNIKWHKVSNAEGVENFYKRLSKEILDEKTPFKLKYKDLRSFHEQLSHSLGASKIIRHADGVPLRTNLQDFIRDTYSLSKAFLDDSVTSENIANFTSKSKKLLNKKSFLAMGLISVAALFTQKVNRYITEKQTGQKGYVGYKTLKNEELDPKEKMQLGIGKLLSSAGIAAIAIATMGSFKPKMLQFSGLMPVVSQSRIISAITNIGRISEASDKTELKESSLREYLGFCNLYVLGDYVQKLTATIIQKRNPSLNILNASKELPKGAGVGKKILHWLKDVSVKSLDEIDGTMKNSSKLKTGRHAVVASQLAGIAYSCIALGIVVPKICANMVKKDEQKRLDSHNSVLDFAAKKWLNKPPERVLQTYSAFLT